MSKTEEVNAWEFVEKYLPNYISSTEVALSNDLQVIVDEEEEQGSHAHRILAEEHYGDRDSVKKLLHEVDETIYKESIEAFMRQGDKLNNERRLVAAIISDHFIESISDKGGYILALEEVANCAKAWCERYREEILNEGPDGTQWDEISEKNGVTDWVELVTKFASEWFDTKGIHAEIKK